MKLVQDKNTKHKYLYLNAIKEIVINNSQALADYSSSLGESLM